MKTKIGALVATLAAAASATGAAVWAKRKRDSEARSRKPAKTSGRQPAGPGGAGSATPSTAAAPSGGGDELTVIKGIGVRSAERLGAMGVTTLAQVAAWSDADIDTVAAQIHVGADRIRREDWVGQARAATGG
jgi:predicted flap endonuclease-1-like 5' DNA nuclease